MPMPKLTNVEQYFKAQPPQVRAILRTVQKTIRRAVPETTETISYQMPAFRLNGRILLYLAGWKNHYSLYPATAAILGTLKQTEAHLHVGRGTLRFALNKPVPVALIRRIAKARASELRDHLSGKKSARLLPSTATTSG